MNYIIIITINYVRKYFSRRYLNVYCLRFSSETSWSWSDLAGSIDNVSSKVFRERCEIEQYS